MLSVESLAKVVIPAQAGISGKLKNNLLGLKKMIFELNNKEVFELINLGQILTPIIITLSIILVGLRKFQLTIFKTTIAILAGWVSSLKPRKRHGSGEPERWLSREIAIRAKNITWKE
ncbi:MAG: hypothetical protein Q8R88_14350 [Desulfoprunum sp.]|nr:hypothetical protein [Desulfoprunum sp.]